MSAETRWPAAATSQAFGLCGPSVSGAGVPDNLAGSVRFWGSNSFFKNAECCLKKEEVFNPPQVKSSEQSERFQ
jgi:hypothetical protein